VLLAISHAQKNLTKMDYAITQYYECIHKFYSFYLLKSFIHLYKKLYSSLKENLCSSLKENILEQWNSPELYMCCHYSLFDPVNYYVLCQ